MDEARGRWIRGLAGVNEHALDLVPRERPQLTQRAVFMLFSTLLSTLAMAVAVNTALSWTWLTGVFLVLWVVMTFYIDRWMFSVRPVSGHRRLLRLLPRVVLAMVFGAILVEPLVLAIFHPEIEARIQSQGLESGLLSQIRVLGQLSEENQFAAAAVWLVRILYIVIYAFPQLIQLLGPPLRYDRVATAIGRGPRVPVRRRARALVVERIASNGSASGPPIRTVPRSRRWTCSPSGAAGCSSTTTPAPMRTSPA